MKSSTLSTLIFPLLTIASPVATPTDAGVSAAQGGFCNIIVPFGVSVACNQGTSDKSPIVYKYSTALGTQFECYATGSGGGWFRTKSPNGVCYVKEISVAEGPLCRANILGVKC